MVQGSRRFAVAGATGRVGRHVVDVLREQGHEVVSISRAQGVDLITSAGLRHALEGVEGVIDAATGPSPEQQAATEFFTTAVRNLHRDGSDAGVRRIVAVSIIGCDKLPGGYRTAKVAHEQALFDGPIPAQVLRAAQFHEFVGLLVDWGTQGDVAYLPRMRTQLVAARSVAEALADLALRPDAPATSPIPEIAGPREESLADAARRLLERQGSRLTIQEVSNPDDPEHQFYAEGGLLPSSHAILAGPTFDEWLAAQSVASVAHR